jgi:hypothetical protein
MLILYVTLLAMLLVRTVPRMLYVWDTVSRH